MNDFSQNVQTKEDKYELRRDFLRSFIFAVIKNSYTPNEAELNDLKKEAEKRKAILAMKSKEIKGSEIMQASMLNEEKKEEEDRDKKVKKLLPRKTGFVDGFMRKKSPPSFQQPQQTAPMQPPQMPPMAQQNKTDYSNLGKIAVLLKDPSVIGIECQGPMKDMLVNRSGRIEKSEMSLSDQDIHNILNEISEKTRIPLIFGVFKALYQNIMVTAVVSEFVGSRFIIQKRNPLNFR